MQKKRQIRSYSVAPLFHKAALKFVMQWKERMRVHKSWIESIERFAACCPRWPRHMAKQDWSECYRRAPNLSAALLNCLREKWAKLATSKPQKLKFFLARNSCVPWDDSFNTAAAVKEANEIKKICDANAPKIPVPAGGRAVTQADLDHLEFCRKVWAGRKFHGPVPSTIGDVPVWDLQDRDIAIAFEKSSSGFPVSKGDVREARRQVIADHRAGERFAKKVLDKDGFLQVEGKSRRRKKRIVRARK
jgi:hypothetical protein